MHFHIITLFPESFSYLDHSILSRAQKNKKITVRFYNPRDFISRPPSLKYQQIDDKPYGGGPGMVMKAEPILKAVDKVRGRRRSVKIIVFSPGGKQFDNRYARKLVRNYKDVILIAGHYEGVDERVVRALKAEKISIGPYILTGGELPAMVVIDAMARQISGVLGKEVSLEETRIASSQVFTRPEVFEYKGKKYRVPNILLSGDHKKIAAWREAHRRVSPPKDAGREEWRRKRAKKL